MVDVASIVAQMRKERGGSVQTVEQYLYIFRVRSRFTMTYRERVSGAARLHRHRLRRLHVSRLKAKVNQLHHCQHDH